MTTTKLAKAKATEAEAKAIGAMLAKVPPTFDLDAMPDAVLDGWHYVDGEWSAAKGKADETLQSAESAAQRERRLRIARAEYMARVWEATGEPSVARLAVALGLPTDKASAERDRYHLTLGIVHLTDGRFLSARDAQRLGITRAKAAHKAAKAADASVSEAVESAKAKAAEAATKAITKAKDDPEADMPKAEAEAEAKAKAAIAKAKAKAEAVARKAKRDAVTAAKREAEAKAKAKAEAADKAKATIPHVEAMDRALAAFVGRCQRNGVTPEAKAKAEASLTDALSDLRAAEAKAEEAEAKTA